MGGLLSYNNSGESALRPCYYGGSGEHVTVLRIIILLWWFLVWAICTSSDICPDTSGGNEEPRREMRRQNQQNSTNPNEQPSLSPRVKYMIVSSRHDSRWPWRKEYFAQATPNVPSGGTGRDRDFAVNQRDRCQANARPVRKPKRRLVSERP